MLRRPEEQIEVTCACGAKFQARNLGRFSRQVCDACLKKFDEAEAARVAAEVERAAQKDQRERILRAGMPANFKDVRFDTCDPKIHPAAFLACNKYAHDFNVKSPSMIIYSEIFGSGKTTLAVCIANYLLHVRHINVRFARARDILLDIKSSFDRGAREDESQVLNRTLSPQLLIMDDLGVDTPTDWTASTFWTIFDRRIELGSPVIVTTNYFPSDDQLGARIGRGALSRLLGMCGNNIITFKGKDLRRSK